MVQVTFTCSCAMMARTRRENERGFQVIETQLAVAVHQFWNLFIAATTHNVDVPLNSVDLRKTLICHKLPTRDIHIFACDTYEHYGSSKEKCTLETHEETTTFIRFISSWADFRWRDDRDGENRVICSDFGWTFLCLFFKLIKKILIPWSNFNFENYLLPTCMFCCHIS